MSEKYQYLNDISDIVRDEDVRGRMAKFDKFTVTHKDIFVYWELRGMHKQNMIVSALAGAAGAVLLLSFLEIIV